MKIHGIPIKNITLDKHGKIIAKPKRQSVSDKIRQRKSKKVRVKPKGKIT